MVKIEKNKILFSEGTRARYFFLIHQGSIQIQSKYNTQTLVQGDCIGELALLSDISTRDCTAVALEDTVCFRLDKKVYQNMYSKQPGYAEAIFKREKIVFFRKVQFFGFALNKPVFPRLSSIN